MKGYKTWLAWLWVASALFWAAAGLAAAPLVITAKDNGKTFSLPVGQAMTVQLDLSGDFQVVAPEFDPSILALVGQTLESSFGSQGSRVRVTYNLVARKEGETDLVISVKSSGAKSGEPKPLLKVKILAGGGTGV